MSTVRMCDFQTPKGPCGVIFSEKEVGWSTGNMTVVGEDGKLITEAADFCPDHSPSAERTNRRNYPRYGQTPQQLAAPASDPKDWTVGWDDTPGS